jgi:hypothetical protein
MCGGVWCVLYADPGPNDVEKDESTDETRSHGTLGTQFTYSTCYLLNLVCIVIHLDKPRGIAVRGLLIEHDIGG